MLKKILPTVKIYQNFEKLQKKWKFRYIFEKYFGKCIKISKSCVQRCSKIEMFYIHSKKLTNFPIIFPSNFLKNEYKVTQQKCLYQFDTKLLQNRKFLNEIFI